MSDKRISGGVLGPLAYQPISFSQSGNPVVGVPHVDSGLVADMVSLVR